MIPEEIDGPNTKLVYMYINYESTPIQPNEAARELDMKELTLLPILRKLDRCDLVEKTSSGYELK